MSNPTNLQFKLYPYLILFIFISNISFGQPEISIEKKFGGSEMDSPSSFQHTSDNGYIIGGSTGSLNGDLGREAGSPNENSMSRSYNKAWVLKLDESLNIEWSNTYGKNTYDNVASIIQSSDGGYIFVSTKEAKTGELKENWWVTKLNSSGEIEWEKSLGNHAKEEANSIIESTNGEFIVLGSKIKITDENLGDGKSRRNETSNVLITKITSIGEIKWQKNIGGDGRDHCRNIKRCKDGNFIIMGSTDSKKIDNLENHGNIDLWIFKISNEGKVIWSKFIGGPEDDYGNTIEVTEDEGFIVGGSIYNSMSALLSVRDNKDNKSAKNSGAWVVKLNKNGEIEWEKTYEKYNYKRISNVDLTDDGGYVFAGYSRTFSKELKKQLAENYSPENNRNGCAFIIKTNSTGDQEWFKILGKGRYDFIYGLKQMSINKYFCLGSINNKIPKYPGELGEFDIWALELQSKKIKPKKKLKEESKQFPKAKQKKKIELFHCEIDTEAKNLIVTVDKSLIGAKYFIMKNRRKTGLKGTIRKIKSDINFEAQGSGKFMFVISHRGTVSNQKFEIE